MIQVFDPKVCLEERLVLWQTKERHITRQDLLSLNEGAQTLQNHTLFHIVEVARCEVIGEVQQEAV